jgi:hypothetical protein
MTALQQEIEQNHLVKITQLPRYISHPDKRAGKEVSSVVIALNSADDAQLLKCTRIIIRYEHRKVTDFHSSRPTDQYCCCLLFGHHHTVCTSTQGPTCAICAGPHSTDLHNCPECPHHVGKTCPHTTYKCANCSATGNADNTHTAYSPRCPVRVAIIQEAWQKSKTSASTPGQYPIDAMLTADE